LKDLSLKIKKGEKVAFVGRTGSGKTSILNILFRLYEIQRGAIYINGDNVRAVSKGDLRRRISIIPQFGFLYKANLRDNVDPMSLYN
jgi:ABC-type multidrug transport system fused ATPase/permease subunit